MTHPINDRVLASFRDPSGFLFQQNGRLLRQINISYQKNYDLLIHSKLYSRLTEKKLLISHQEVNVEPPQPDIAYKVIEPEKLRFISYPYEWSFSQLKDAALLTLRIQKEAFRLGLILKDASAYNIQFHQGHPILIDTLSFAEYQEGDPWIAYRQFCMHFLAPLALMSNVDIRLGRLSQLYLDGVPLDLASQLLPLKTRLSFGLLTHLHLHADFQNRHSEPPTGASQTKRKMSKTGMIGLLDSLENTIQNFNWKPQNTQWVDYYSSTNYTEPSFELKKQIVRDLIFSLSPKTIWDLGSNSGVFSRLAVELKDCLIISSDIDPGAVELNYLECKRTSDSQVYPLIIDLTNPSPAIGWGNTERQSFFQRGPADLVIGLALIHHLAISNNLPLEDISRWMASLGKYLIIEFVPKDDSQAKKLLSSRDDIFPAYTEDGFVQAFTHDFCILKQIPIEGTSRTIFLFEAKQT